MIRDVGGSYRRAIVETVHHYSGVRPAPDVIDALKAEGCWNNDWQASLELLRRGLVSGTTGDGAEDPGEKPPAAEVHALMGPDHALDRQNQAHPAADCAAATRLDAAAADTTAGEGGAASSDPVPDRVRLPAFDALVEVFNGFYFGGDPEGDPALWQGFIGDEPLLVQPGFFDALTQAGVAWGFVSGAEPPSARFVLQQRLGLADPPLIAMGDAPDKPDPTGLLRLAAELAGVPLGEGAVPVAYLGDTVADVLTVMRARELLPEQRFLSLAVAPPHLQAAEAAERRASHEAQLLQAGADRVIPQTARVLEALEMALAA